MKTDTNTAKPTAGPWIDRSTHVTYGPDDFIIAEVTSKEDCALIAEAGTIYNETGLTPRELMERYNEAMALLDECKYEVGNLRALTDEGRKSDSYILHQKIKKFLKP